MSDDEMKKSELSKIREKFQIFGLLSFLFAVFYAICFHKAGKGITVPIFTIGTAFFLLNWIKQVGVKRKGEAKFYLGSMILLGFSVFLTDSGFIRFFSKTGIIILFICIMIYKIQDEKNWEISKYTKFSLDTMVKTIGNFHLPVVDLINTKKGKHKNLKNVLIGLIIAIPLVILVLSLLSDADIIFANAVALERWFKVTDTLTFILLVVFIYFLLYSFMVAVEEKMDEKKEKIREGTDAVIAMTFTSILLVIYAIFSFIQIFALFLEKMQLPDGYSYAEYAREGFFQLLAICILNMFLVLICIKIFKEHKILKLILMGISICTYIIILSSAFRMVMYVREYQLTFLRVFVFWVLGTLAILMFGLILRIFKQKFPSFRYTMVVVTVCYLIFAFMKPDYIIAKYNLNHMVQKAEESDQDIYFYQDMEYIFSLSADIMPALKDYIEESEYLKYSQKDQHDVLFDLEYYITNYELKEESIREFNISRNIADKNVNYIKRKMNWE